ncbi:hypothetical protein PInf_006959 [Phytophthora infestans]|nr:hypothetical protein PInf_006959 [Phytophthora infestans]
MALPPRGLWDVTYLGAKYPWLRVDQQALEEFRSPFQWYDLVKIAKERLQIKLEGASKSYEDAEARSS